MRIIISPAKKMNVDTDTLPAAGIPAFLQEAEEITVWMKGLTLAEAQKLWGCNEKLAELNYRRFREMDLRDGGGRTPALLSYEGIQYQHMVPAVFTDREWEYIQEHLRILSGFYGMLKPLDGVVPYRLEMQAKAKVRGTRNLYEYWGRSLYEALIQEDRVILNLASKEYAKCIESYLEKEDRFVTCIFGEWQGEKLIQKGTLAKMARGEMVRFLAENGIEDVDKIRGFSGLGYVFSEEMSSEKEYVFIREEKEGMQL